MFDWLKRKPEEEKPEEATNDSTRLTRDTSAWTYTTSTYPIPAGLTYPFLLGVPAQKPSPQPPVEAVPSTETVIGYRAYTASPDGVLRGAKNTWPASTFQAECGGDVGFLGLSEKIPTRDLCLEHMASATAYEKAHGYAYLVFSYGTIMGCGIYAMKDRKGIDRYDADAIEDAACTQNPPMHRPMRGKPWVIDEWLHYIPLNIEAETVLYGTVHDCEYGYRASDAKIERLWVMQPFLKCDSCGQNLVLARHSAEWLNQVVWACPGGEMEYLDTATFIDALKERYQVPVEIEIGGIRG